MTDGPDIARIGSLLGDHARADMLTALLSDQALTATELASVAMITKQTASSHLAKLVDARLVAVERQGRHRYFRLADPDVADLLERMTGLAFRAGAVRLRLGPREPALRRARVCYDHLAGEIGVQLFESMVSRGWVERHGDTLEVTASGRQAFADLGLDIDADSSRRRPLVRLCLDWSVRRHHLAGALGAALLDRSLVLGWARRSTSSRAMEFSRTGEVALRDRFGVSVGSARS
jgi:DNA-binding transcriptional ArsR family regulator